MKKYLFIILSFFFSFSFSFAGDIVWQDFQTVYATQPNALIYCQYLEEDGETVSETIQDYWRLPKLGELLNALSQQFFEGGTEGPGGFVEGPYYWSGTEYDSDFAYLGSVDVGVVSNLIDYKSNEYSVRCVHDVETASSSVSLDNIKVLFDNSMSNISFGLAVIITLLFVVILGFMFNNMHKRK